MSISFCWSINLILHQAFPDRILLSLSSSINLIFHHQMKNIFIWLLVRFSFFPPYASVSFSFEAKANNNKIAELSSIFGIVISDKEKVFPFSIYFISQPHLFSLAFSSCFFFCAWYPRVQREEKRNRSKMKIKCLRKLDGTAFLGSIT